MTPQIKEVKQSLKEVVLRGKLI